VTDDRWPWAMGTNEPPDSVVVTHMCVCLPGLQNLSPTVYAYGILLYELYTGQHAYFDIPPPMLAYHVATAGGRPLLPQHCPTAYRALAKACWSSDVAVRSVCVCVCGAAARTCGWLGYRIPACRP
jgi:hypothetical protein